MNPGGDRLRILVIDDDPDVLSFIAEVLGDLGYRALTTTSSEQGLEMARRQPPDLICLDISMPPPTGVRVYRELRQDPGLRRIPVVMVTGVDHRFKAFISTRRHLPPPDGFVAKPFRAHELCSVIEEILGPRAVVR